MKFINLNDHSLINLDHVYFIESPIENPNGTYTISYWLFNSNVPHKEVVDTEIDAINRFYRIKKLLAVGVEE